MVSVNDFMKRILTAVLWAAVVHACVWGIAQAQEDPSPLDSKIPPADYGAQKKQVQDKAERLRRSQLIQEVSSTYREMVASFKARQVEHGEDLSQKLDALLDDPLLPADFAEKIRVKQQNFLERVYGKEVQLAADIPVDRISDEELPAIRERMPDFPKPAEVVPGRISAGGLAVEKTGETTENAQLPKQKANEGLIEKKRQEALSADIEAAAVRDKGLSGKTADAVVPAGDPLSAVQSRKDYEEDRQAAVKQRQQAEQELEKYTQGVRDGQDADGLTKLQREALAGRKEKIDAFLKKYRSEMTARRKDLQSQFDLRIEELYRDGVEFYEKKAYRTAWDLLSEVEELSPGYKDARRILDSIRMYVDEELAHERQQKIGDLLDQYQQSIQ